ncbi:MAG: hypothetical protein CVU91_08300 [Firmicutes bacterium HGW-Firmicutes-16]|nr:MAG: hypothetical protein CVU91_08300 [Firmicutes bacterium HGW-Firmicutes-16]
MINQNKYVITSLDLNLFFLRIMKEHSFFLEMGFTQRDINMAAQARRFRSEFEKLLDEATQLANGNVSQQAIASRQFVTQYTADAEKLTSFYTGIPFNTNLTQREMMLSSGNALSPDIVYRVDSLNRRAYRMTSALADFKTNLLQNVLSCNAFTANYPLLIEHILREANLYMEMLNNLVNQSGITETNDLIDMEVFWNRQMAEHAKFIAGLLDPTEETLIDTARDFGKEFDKLTEEARQSTMRTIDEDTSTSDSIAAMERLRAFKAAGTEGLLECKIKSIIIPLLADHVLREANHYLCILGECYP